MTLGTTGRSGKIPSSLRFSVTKAVPCLAAARGLDSRTLSPFSKMVPRTSSASPSEGAGHLALA